MNTEKYLLFLVTAVSYIVGSIPFGYIIGKINGIDIRKHGSGNIGATNVLRTLGRKWGYLCFLLDFMKGFLLVLTTELLVKNHFSTIDPQLASACAMAGAFCGHLWTIFLKFKGGKGISTAAGAIFAISPFAFFASLITWFCIFSISKYVSLSSIIASLTLPLAYLFVGQYANSPYSLMIMTAFSAISLISILKHIPNIKRLFNGTEMRFGGKEKI
jgi:glycerol-3-phosphate acyltransferase PlsY